MLTFANANNMVVIHSEGRTTDAQQEMPGIFYAIEVRF